MKVPGLAHIKHSFLGKYSYHKVPDMKHSDFQPKKYSKDLKKLNFKNACVNSNKNPNQEGYK